MKNKMLTSLDLCKANKYVMKMHQKILKLVEEFWFKNIE